MNKREPISRRGAALLLTLCAAVASSTALAAKPTTEAQEIAAIKQSLATRYPEVQVTDISPSPLPGIYAVFSANSVVYTDRTGQYVFVGPMVDTLTKTDLSRQALDARDSIKFADLPLDQAIKTVRGSGERTLAVFADPDCPYCENLEKELAGLNDVTIYTFLFPLTQLHPDARNKAHAIWCAGDRSETWHDWMILAKSAPPAAADCTQDPIDSNLTLGKNLKILSTPTVFLENGHRVSGSRTAAELNALLGTAHADKLHVATNNPEQPKS